MILHRFHVTLCSARLAWPTTLLVLLLQRTPVLRQLVSAEFFSSGTVGQLLRAVLPAAAGLGVTHTLTGQTRWTTNPASPVSGQVGTELTVAFAFTGGSATPESYSIVGTLPPGLSVPNAGGIPGNLTLNSSIGGSVTGTPTGAGSFAVTLTAYDSPNRGAGEHGSSPAFTLEFLIEDSTSAPAFTTHPSSQTVMVGGNVTFTVAVSGAPPPTLQWRKDNANLAGETGATLTLNSVTLDSAGVYDCVATNAEGSVTSNAATLTVDAPAAPTITTQPIAIRSLAGSGAFFSVQATGEGLSYQWRKDGDDLAGETGSSIFLPAVAADDAGAYSVRVSNAGGAVTSNAVALTVATSGRARLVNLSARAMVGTGDDVLIPGFAVAGGGTKTVLVRAIGPKLADFSVAGVLADPSMQLFRGATASEANDDWGQFADQALLEETRLTVGAFDISDSSQPLKDSSMVVNFGGGNYTIRTFGVGNTTGVALVELFDADPATATARFVNISARAQVGTGGDVLIPGFFIEGDVALTLLIRAVGPTLGATPYNVPGVLQDPVMTLFRITNSPNPGDQEVMTVNDDWEDASDVEALEEIRIGTGAFALAEGGADGTLLVSLNPGGYTVKVEGKDDGTGVALMEIYLVGP